MISLLIFSFCVPQLLFSQSRLESEGFIPNKDVEKHAQEADKKNFPLFLASFEWIRNRDSLKLPLYYLAEAWNLVPGKPVDLRDHSLLKIKPVYKLEDKSITGFDVTFPIDWSDKVTPNLTWRLYFQSLIWLLPYLRSAEFDSAHTGLCVVNDWIIHHLDYPLTVSEYAYDDHAAAERLVVLVEASKRYAQLKVVDRELQINILLAILNHIFFISSLEKYSCWHNHAIIFDEKLIISLKQLKGFRERQELLNLAFRRVFEQYRYSYTSEGVHKEHSPCYHRGFSGTLNSLVATANELNIPIPGNIQEIRRKAANYIRYLDFIGYDFPVGDCARPKPLVTLGEPKASAKKESTADRLLYKSNERTKIQPVDMRFMIFPNTGWLYAFDSVYRLKIVAQSDFFSFTHYQKDETSFIIKVKSQNMIIDPGLYSYSLNKIYDYYRSGDAHNVIVIDGLKEDINLTKTGLSGITRTYQQKGQNGVNVLGIEMTKPHYRKYGVDVSRQFIFPGGHEMVIRDIIRSKDKHTYKQLFHLAPNAIVTKKGNKFFIKWNNSSNYLVIKSKFDSYRLVSGQEEPFQGWYFPAFNEIAPAPVLELVREERDCDFTTYISIKISHAQKSSRRKTVRGSQKVISNLESVEQWTLTHLPFPVRWKPER